jgi:hypothetical protein
VDVGVREHRLCPDDAPSLGHDADDPLLTVPFLHQNPFDQHPFPTLHAVAFQLGDHFFDQQVGSPPERENPGAHEIGEHDAVRDRRVVQSGTVGVRDRFHQQPVHIGPTREETLKQIARRFRVVVVVVHRPQVVVEPFDRFRRQLELLDQHPGVVVPGERGPDVHLRVHEPNILKLDNGIRNFPSPVFATGLDHAARETVQRDVKNVPPFAREPRRQAPELVMVLQQQHPVARLREDVRAGQSAQSAADHDHIVVVGDAFEPIVSHGNRQMRWPAGKAQQGTPSCKMK